MSKKKNPTSYQFLINTPNPKKSKKRPDPKKTLEKWGLRTEPELSLNIFKFFLKKKVGMSAMTVTITTKRNGYYQIS